MPTIETPRALAQYGGWKPVVDASNDQLDGRYRHFGVVITSPKTLNLPFAMLLDGRPILPLGHVVHVHNKSASQSVTVSVNATPGGGAFSSKVIAAHQTCSFLLVGYHASRAGIWRIVATDHAHASGPTSPDGFRIEITLQEPRNNVNLLEEAIALGYDGSQPAMVIVHVTEFAHLGSTSNLFPSLSTGGDAAIGGINWFAGSTVYMRNEGTIQGMGGRGGTAGIGGTGSATGSFQTGEDGGPALRAAIDIFITNHGKILGGCGGGGGGDGVTLIAGVNGGGGGGGGGARVLGNQAVIGGTAGSGGNPQWAGGTGSTSQGGVGGTPTQQTAPGPVVTVGGFGGAGGSYAATTLTPSAGGGATLPNNAGPSVLGTGGAAGAAISRASGVTVTIVAGSSGIVGGATIVV